MITQFFLDIGQVDVILCLLIETNTRIAYIFVFLNRTTIIEFAKLVIFSLKLNAC